MKKSEFELWLNLPQTREVLTIVQKEIDIIEDALISGLYINEPTIDKVASKYIDGTATLSGLKFITSGIIAHLEDDMKEEEDYGR